MNWPVNNYFFVEIFKSLPNFSSLANSVYHELNYETKYGNTGVRGAGEVLVFYLPIRFFYYLANLIIFTRSSRIPCIFFLEGGFKGIYLREKNFTLSYVLSEI